MGSWKYLCDNIIQCNTNHETMIKKEQKRQFEGKIEIIDIKNRRHSKITSILHIQ